MQDVLALFSGLPGIRADGRDGYLYTAGLVMGIRTLVRETVVLTRMLT